MSSYRAEFSPDTLENLDARIAHMMDLTPALASAPANATPASDRKTCMPFSRSRYPSSPVVVQTLSGASNFVMCTAPKAGCSHLRSLLLIATIFPAPVRYIGERSHVHEVPYPTLYHFEGTDKLPDNFPIFAVGRNPYTRLLSGYLDKLTVRPNRDHDFTTHKNQNTALGLDAGAWHAPTPKGFRRFVRLLADAVAKGRTQNEHFAPAAAICRVAEVPYHYMLRLEDMPEWLPCLDEGLGLERFTATGWNYKRLRRDDWYSARNTGCFWAPHGTSCTDFYAATRTGSGRRVPWSAGAKGGVGAAAGSGEGRSNGTAYNLHATAASAKWRMFYDQETADTVYELMQADFAVWGYERETFSDA